MENIYDTHFVFITESAKTLEFIGDKEVRCDDVISGDGKDDGRQNCYKFRPMIIFQNQNRSYPILGLQD